MMTAQEIRDGMKAEGIGAGMASIRDITVDTAYALPTEDWLFGPLGEFFQAACEFFKLTQASGEPWDCDKRALLWTVCTRIAHANTTKVNCGIGTGFLGFLNQQVFPPDPHVVGAAWVNSGGKRKLVFAETTLSNAPKTELEPEERASARMYYI